MRKLSSSRILQRNEYHLQHGVSLVDHRIQQLHLGKIAQKPARGYWISYFTLDKELDSMTSNTGIMRFHNKKSASNTIRIRRYNKRNQSIRRNKHQNNSHQQPSCQSHKCLSSQQRHDEKLHARHHHHHLLLPEPKRNFC